MPNDTSTGGFLSPSNAVSNDLALEDIFQIAIVGITGLVGSKVRPGFQPTTPNLPGFDEDWIAYQVKVVDQDTFSHIQHQHLLEPGGASVVSRDEEFEVLLSFYGPNGGQLLSRWREGLDLDPNRWGLLAYGIKLQFVGSPVMLPALLKERWVRRIDLKATFTRRIKVTYPVRTVVESHLGLDNEYYITPIVLQQP
jgi:hypothetical protein